MAIVLSQQNLLGAGGILQTGVLSSPLRTILNPLSIFSGTGTSYCCSSSEYYSQSCCGDNQGIMQMMMGMFAMMMGFMQNIIGSMFNRGGCGCQDAQPQQQPIVINNYYDCSDRSVHNTTKKYVTNNYTTNNKYITNKTTNTTVNNIDNSTHIQNTNINNTLNQKNINNIYDTKINNTNINDIDNIVNQTFVA